jgi:uncharacterized protein (UPF0212 family)
MNDATNYVRAELTCPHCGKQFDKDAVWLNEHPSFPCPACGQLLDDHHVDASTIKEVNQQVRDFLSGFGRKGSNRRS